MKTIIYSLEENNGKVIEESVYSLPPKQALIAFVKQLKNDFNTWLYPVNMDGIWESKRIKGVYYYYDSVTEKTYQATQHAY